MTYSQFIRDARRSQGLTQQDVARIINASQSQISAFENGSMDSLSRYKRAALLNLLGIQASINRSEQTLAYCSNLDCPGTMPYWSEGKVIFQPIFYERIRGHPIRCGLCAETLTVECHKCGQPISQGYYCGCGEPYIDVPKTDEVWGTDHIGFDAAQIDNLCQRTRSMRREMTSFQLVKK